jgi:hypothetical protein
MLNAMVSFPGFSLAKVIAALSEPALRSFTLVTVKTLNKHLGSSGCTGSNGLVWGLGELDH